MLLLFNELLFNEQQLPQVRRGSVNVHMNALHPELMQDYRHVYSPAQEQQLTDMISFTFVCFG